MCIYHDWDIKWECGHTSWAKCSTYCPEKQKEADYLAKVATPGPDRLKPTPCPNTRGAWPVHESKCYQCCNAEALAASGGKKVMRVLDPDPSKLDTPGAYADHRHWTSFIWDAVQAGRTETDDKQNILKMIIKEAQTGGVTKETLELVHGHKGPMPEEYAKQLAQANQQWEEENQRAAKNKKWQEDHKARLNEVESLRKVVAQATERRIETASGSGSGSGSSTKPNKKASGKQRQLETISESTTKDNDNGKRPAK